MDLSSLETVPDDTTKKETTSSTFTGRDVITKQTLSTACTDPGYEAWTLAFAPSSDGTETRIYTGADDSSLRCLRIVESRDRASDGLVRDAEDEAADEDEDENKAADDDQDGEEDSTIEEIWTDKRTHTAGVVAILPLSAYLSNTFPSPTPASPTQNVSKQPPEILLTGSYDDNLRILSRDASSPAKRPCTVLAQADLGGGVWRLHALSFSEREGACADVGNSNEEKGPGQGKGQGEERVVQRAWTVLASCMHAGARVVRVEQWGCASEDQRQDRDRDQSHGYGEVGQWTITVLAKFEEHASMNYGSDVQPVISVSNGLTGREDDGDAGRTRTVVSTSFYDRLMCLWRFRHQDADA